MNCTFDNFVGIYDNVLTPSECQEIIKYFDLLYDNNLVIDSKDYTKPNTNLRKDKSVFMHEPRVVQLHQTQFCFDVFTRNFWPCYSRYMEEYSALHSAAKHGILGLRVQKTIPGGGFHDWHFENGEYALASRIVTMMMYLNDVEDGGETEFLYLHKRIKPKAGRLLIWPSGYTHTHRGNPPLSGEKYIVTGWLNLVE